MQIRQIIVVEGKSDTAKIKQAVLADTIETNGSAISRETIDVLQHAHEKRGIIVFTDPDYAGERIRHIIQKHIPTCQHAFLRKNEAIPKRKQAKSVGIEHATVEAIQQALHQVHDLASTEAYSQTNQITRADVLAHGLIGKSDSAMRRKYLGDLLHIGKVNGKQLVKRLSMFDISKEAFLRAVEQMEEMMDKESQ